MSHKINPIIRLFFDKINGMIVEAMTCLSEYVAAAVNLVAVILGVDVERSPLPSFFLTTIARMVPSLESETGPPLLSPAASPSLS